VNTKSYSLSEVGLLVLILLTVFFVFTDSSDRARARTEQMQVAFLIDQCRMSKTMSIRFGDGSETACLPDVKSNTSDQFIRHRLLQYNGGYANGGWKRG